MDQGCGRVPVLPAADGVVSCTGAPQGVQRALLPAGSAATSGHVTLLKQKALTAILRRLDALLFGKLLGGAGPCLLSLSGIPGGLRRLICPTEQSRR